jgi:hypothetical protein
VGARGWSAVMTDSGYAPSPPLPSLLRCPDDMLPGEWTGGAGGEPVDVEEWASLAAADDAEQEIIPAHTAAVLSAPAVLAAVVYAASVAQVRVVFRHAIACATLSQFQTG